MTTSTWAGRRARLEPLLESARMICDATSERGQQARKRLATSSGLSAEGVDFALKRCLEADPSEAELDALLRSTAEAPSAHVLLSAHVFVAAHRAIAIGLAASASVCVRPSRREPEMAELLLEGAPDSFQLKTELTPQPHDHLWAYGSDVTLREIASKLAQGIVLHAHGTGFGVGVLGAHASDAELEPILEKFAEDIALFDQRGCLSPRVLLVSAGLERALEVAAELAKCLTRVEARLPRGRLDRRELAEIASYRDSASYAGEIFAAGHGFVSAGSSELLMLAPVGRNMHVLSTLDPAQTLASCGSLVTSYAIAGDAELRRQLERALPSARACEFGQMQTPPFDGPVDRRAPRF